MIFRSALPATLLWIALAGCASRGVAREEPDVDLMPDTQAVAGSVTFRERMALPADAVVEIVLSDVSRQDVAATAVAETTLVAAGRQVPIAFALRYDPSRIDPSHRYAVRATVRTGGRMLFTTDRVYPVITQGSPTQVTLTLVRVSTGTVEPSASLQGTSWVLVELGGRPVLDDVEATLEFPEAGRVAGNGSCNRFFGTVQTSGDSISFGQMGATQMACPDPIQTQENGYLQALESAERFTIDGDTLLIHSRGAERPLRFRSAR